MIDENIMPAKPSDKEQSSDNETSESEKNIMPHQNNNVNGSSAAKDDLDVDLEKIMEDSAFPANNSNTRSTSSSSSSSSSSAEETSSEESSFICLTAMCGDVFDTAAGLRARERKYSG